MLLPEIEVLVRSSGLPESEQSGSLQQIAVQSGETVAGLKRWALSSEGVRVSENGGVSLVFNGVELADSCTLDQCGLHAATGEESWAENFIYPNGWQQMSHKKATAKARTDPESRSAFLGPGGSQSWAVIRSLRWFSRRLAPPWLLLVLLILLANMSL